MTLVLLLLSAEFIILVYGILFIIIVLSLFGLCVYNKVSNYIYINSKDYIVRNPADITNESDIENKLGYHRQYCTLYTLGEAIQYIEAHDHWRSSKAKRFEKRKEAKQSKINKDSKWR